MLDKFSKKDKTIVCLAIENGIGLYPVEKIVSAGEMKLSNMPLASKDNSQYYFYDQAHILLDFNKQRIHHVTKPTTVSYVLTSSDKNKLDRLFESGKPSNEYYFLQSVWSQEMLKRIKNPMLGSPYPLRNEGDKELTSDDLIRESLQVLLQNCLRTQLVSAPVISIFNNTQPKESEPVGVLSRRMLNPEYRS